MALNLYRIEHGRAYPITGALPLSAASANVERVMGFCTDADVEEFFRSVPEFERMLVRSGILLIKYWFSITDDEQHFRFMMRVHDPLKQWKLSPMDLESRRRWEAYTKAKEAMLERTHIGEAPWWIVEADDKKRAPQLHQPPLERGPLSRGAARPDFFALEGAQPRLPAAPVPQKMYVPSSY
jgi:polyphosphate kinase